MNYLNFMIRLIVFLKTKIFSNRIDGISNKQENIFSVFYLQYLLFSNDYIDFKSLKSLLKRFIYLLNEIKSSDINEYTTIFK